MMYRRLSAHNLPPKSELTVNPMGKDKEEIFVVIRLCCRGLFQNGQKRPAGRELQKG
jgi:hypothetical protein